MGKKREKKQRGREREKETGEMGERKEKSGEEFQT